MGQADVLVKSIDIASSSAESLLIVFTMTSSVRKGLEAFDFKEEDELPEFSGGKYGGRSTSPNYEDNAIMKYEFMASGRFLVQISSIRFDFGFVEINF